MPPSHFVGVSMGSCISLQIAISYPKNALSLTMISPLPLTEVRASLRSGGGIQNSCMHVDSPRTSLKAGRRFTTVGWKPSRAVRSTRPLYLTPSAAPFSLDSAASRRASTARTSHLFVRVSACNNSTSPFDSLVARCVPQALKNWGPKKLADYRIVTVDFFTKRKAQTAAAVSKITCPVKLVHCGADIAYAIEYSAEVLKLLQENGVDASLVEIPGAVHFGNVSHPKE